MILYARSCPRCKIGLEGKERGYCRLCRALYQREWRKRQRYGRRMITNKTELDDFIKGYLSEGA